MTWALKKMFAVAPQSFKRKPLHQYSKDWDVYSTVTENKELFQLCLYGISTFSTLTHSHGTAGKPLPGDDQCNS